MQRAGSQGVLPAGLVPLFALVELHEGRLQRHGGVGQGRVDVLTLTGALPVQQGQGHTVGAHETGAVVVHRVGLRLGHAIAAEATGHPGGGLGKPLVARPFRRALLPHLLHLATDGTYGGRTIGVRTVERKICLVKLAEEIAVFSE